jgi:hypothetical protein
MEIPIVLEPRIAKALETVCKNALAYGQNHREVRASISNLIVLLEQQVSEPCVEIANLRNLLKRADPDYSSRPAAELDPIYELALGSNPQITADQQAAAYQIKKVWAAFSRYLTVQAKNLESNGGSKSRRLDPLDAMSTEVARLWKDIYTPWYAKARKSYIARSGINEAEIVLKVVVDCQWPHQLDKRFGLTPGSSLIAVQHQLTSFQDLA